MVGLSMGWRQGVALVYLYTFIQAEDSPFSLSLYTVSIKKRQLLLYATAAIAGSGVETTHRPGLFSSTTFSRPQANFLHQTCIAGLVKHLSPYTGRISE